MISSTQARASGGLQRKRRELEVEALELGAPDRLESLPERDDGGDGAARAEPGDRTCSTSSATMRFGAERPRWRGAPDSPATVACRSSML